MSSEARRQLHALALEHVADTAGNQWWPCPSPVTAGGNLRVRVRPHLSPRRARTAQGSRPNPHCATGDAESATWGDPWLHCPQLRYQGVKGGEVGSPRESKLRCRRDMLLQTEQLLCFHQFQSCGSARASLYFVGGPPSAPQAVESMCSGASQACARVRVPPPPSRGIPGGLSNSFKRQFPHLQNSLSK